MPNIANVPGILIPGTKVHASFPSFSGPFPDLYEKAHQGSLNLASVNAGNSDSLCVGLGGVNFGFYEVLTGAGQKSANLNPQPAAGKNKPCSQTTAAAAADDYQGRHLKLLAKAGVNGTAFETYTNTDPCCFAYVTAVQRQGAPGTEGICFVDVFDPKLCPEGNAKNVAMLYMIPPDGVNYTQKADFLAAVQAAGENIIEAISAYNALAPAQSLPVIEALRNTLYSSNNYKFAGATNDEIARAIFAGFSAALASHPNSGLLELQFPVNTGASRLFEAVQSDLMGPPTQLAHQPPLHAGAGHGPVVEMWEPEGGETDDDSDDIELPEVDSNGVPVTTVTADGQAVSNQGRAVNSAAAQDLGLLRQGQPPQNYTRFPQPRYAAANSPLVQESRGQVARAGAGIYAGVSPHEMIGDVPDPIDSPALQAAKQAKVAVDAVREASFQMLDAPNLKAAKAQLDLARLQARAARQAATTSDTAARNAERNAGDDQDAAGAANDRNYANAADEIASGAEATARSMEIHYEDLKRSEAARTSSKRPLIYALASIVTVFGSLGLLWTFLFGYGRKVVALGAGRFFTKDLDIMAADTVLSVDVDVIAELEKVAGETFHYIKAVHLADANGKPIDQLSDSTGMWAAANKHITYTPPNPKPSTPPAVKYMLEAEGPVAAPLTDPSKLTITFVAAGTPNPATATDKIVAASSRTAAVSFAVGSGFSFDGGAPADTEGAWSYDSVTNQASFAPNSGTTVAAAIKSATYRLDPAGNTAKLVALFPAKPLGPAIGSRMMEYTFPAADYDVTLLDSTGQPTTNAVVQTGIGTWTVAERQIKFVPDSTLAATTSSAAVNYAYVYGGATSVTATVTVTLPAAGQPPVASDLSKVTADRTKTISFDLVGAAPSGSWTDANGTWASQGNQVTFTPNKPLTAGQITSTVSYTLSDAAGQSNPAKLSVTYLPSPAAVSQTASRLINPAVNIGSGNAAATAPYSVKLWDLANAKPVDTLGDAASGYWSVDAASRTVIFNLPSGPIDPQDSKSAKGLLRFADSQVSVSYVLVANVSATGKPLSDGTYSDHATITVNFNTDPVAYDVSAVFPYLQFGTATVDILKHCVVPGGFLKARLNGSDNPITEADKMGRPIANWTYLPPSPPDGPTIRFAQTAFVDLYSIQYSVLDAQGKESKPASITLKFDVMAMPRSSTLLLAQDVTGGKAAAADVITPASSFYDKDPKSVRFTGLQDLEDDQLPPDSLLRKDGKAISVPGEGVWMVDDLGGKIAFQSDAALNGVPTPALVQFADVKGNWSNPAPIVIDATLSQIPAIGTALAKMDDATFWAAFTKHLAQAQPNQGPLAPETFIAGTLALAGAVRPAVEIGQNPVTRAALDAAYAQWDKAGQPWDPNDDATNNLVAIATATVPLDKVALRARYWALDTISRMLTRGLPDN